MTAKPKTKKAISWVAKRLKEPSTYAGLAAGALALAEVAKQAEHVSHVFKDSGTVAGVFALIAAAAAVTKAEPEKQGETIDAEFTEVKE